jgi:glycogen debranching enzyme
MDAAGLWPQVATGLRFLAKYQREDGKITHEISQAAGHIPWFEEFPYAYYHLDTTPYWILAVWRYWLASGDDELVDDLWPSIQRAYAWSLTRDTDGDGLIENGPGNLGAIEIGALGADLHEDIYVAAVWLEALPARSCMARAVTTCSPATPRRATRAVTRP